MNNTIKVLIGGAVTTFVVLQIFTWGNIGIPAALFWTALTVVVAAINAQIKSTANIGAFLEAEGAQQIDSNDPEESWLPDMVHSIATEAGLANMPTVAWIAADEVNAFAIGNPKKSAIVFYSGLLKNLSKDELRAVTGHEITHILNDDCTSKVAMFSAIQGITYVILAPLYLVGFMAQLFLGGVGAQIAAIISNLMGKFIGTVFGFAGELVAMNFSRTREYVADQGGAQLSAPEHMISALNNLEKLAENQNTGDPILSALCIYSPASYIVEAFSTHPTTQNRVRTLGMKEKVVTEHSEQQKKEIDPFKLVLAIAGLSFLGMFIFSCLF